jgi:hypothetical protein
VFFAATKLFQARDPHLRRMVYLCIKDICPGSDEVRGGCGPAAGRLGVAEDASAQARALPLWRPPLAAAAVVRGNGRQLQAARQGPQHQQHQQHQQQRGGSASSCARGRAALRRCADLRHLAPAAAPQVIIVTSSLMKDMNSNVDLYRANAVRVLCQIVDGQLLAQIERYLKQAVVDKRWAPCCAGQGGAGQGSALPLSAVMWCPAAHERACSRAAEDGPG